MTSLPLLAAMLLAALAALPQAGLAAGSPLGIDPAPYRLGLDANDHAYQTYRVDTQQSQLLLQIFKAGFLSAFGHNHVLALRHIDGLVLLAADASKSRAELLIPVAVIEVDNASLRLAAGDGFDSKPSTADVAATRDNMLSADQLDAAQYPHIRVLITVQRWQPPQAQLKLMVTLRGRSTELLVPAEVQLVGDTLRLQADLELSQRALGITPFSALAGSLKVADVITLSVSLLARRVTAL